MTRNSILMLIPVLALVTLAGCPSSGGSPPVTTAAEGVAGIVAHTESAQRDVANAAAYTDRVGKAHLAAAGEEHQAILTNADTVRNALTAAGKQIETLTGKLSGAQADYGKLEAKWYVVWGRRIERVLWVIGIGWLLAGVASVVFGLSNPLSWSWRLGKEITRFVPAMNPFSWIRDWLLSRKAAATAEPANG